MAATSRTRTAARTAITTSFTTESLLTHKVGFDLDASPLQRAIARAADGLPIPASLLDDEAVETHFGCDRSRIGLAVPVLVVVVAGVRGGKSLMAACAAVKGCLTADLSALKSHEVPRYAIVAPTVDNANATFRLLVGAVQASRVLSKMVEGEPTADTLTLRRPDGRLVEIVVVAAHRGAVTLRSRWLAGFCLDEAALFGTEATGAAVNAEELLRAGETRLVRGAQGWIVTSPFGPSGLVFDLWRAHFGKPGRVLVVHAPTRSLNPSFPAEQIEAIRAKSPDVAAREYDAEWVDADVAFFDGSTIDSAVREAPLEEAPLPGVAYAAAMDPATRSNSWTLVIARSQQAKGDSLPHATIVLATQWTGSKKAPLDPSLVLAEVRDLLARYRCRRVYSDCWAADALKSIAKGLGLEYRDRTSTQLDTTDLYTNFKTLLSTGRLTLAPHPVLLQDLKSVRKKALANGIKIDLPKTADGRHADMAPAAVLAVAMAAHARPGRGDLGSDGLPRTVPPLALGHHEPFAGRGPAGGMWGTPTSGSAGFGGGGSPGTNSGAGGGSDF